MPAVCCCHRGLQRGWLRGSADYAVSLGIQFLRQLYFAQDSRGRWRQAVLLLLLLLAFQSILKCLLLQGLFELLLFPDHFVLNSVLVLAALVLNDPNLFNVFGSLRLHSLGKFLGAKRILNDLGPLVLMGRDNLRLLDCQDRGVLN